MNMKNESKKFTMKVLYSFITIVFTALVYLVAISNADKKSPFKMTSKTSGLKIEKRLIRVAYKAATPSEEQIADILWIQKAAKMTKKIGFPYFKILFCFVFFRFLNYINFFYKKIMFRRF